jgi:hypothetical protein
MQWGLKMCFKLLKRTQRARGSVRDQRRAWRPRRSSGRGGGGVARGEEGSEESYGGGQPESDTWGHWEAGGGADQVATTASGGERRLGQTTGGVARRGGASAGSGERWRWAEMARGSARAARGRRGRSTWPAERRRRAGKETEEVGGR